MAITKKPQSKPQGSVPNGQMAAALQKFIEAAPDGSKKAVPEGDSVQITLRLSREDLERLTKMAQRQGIARASYIKRAVFVQLEGDEAK